jgi:hypothetical protein
MNRRGKRQAKRSRRQRTTQSRRRPETETAEIDLIDRELSGVFAVFVMAPLVVLGIVAGYVVAERNFDPGGYEVAFAVVGGALGGVAGWLVGRPAYRLFARPARALLRCFGVLLIFTDRSRNAVLYRRRRSASGHLSDLLTARKQLERDQS